MNGPQALSGGWRWDLGEDGEGRLWGGLCPGEELGPEQGASGPAQPSSGTAYRTPAPGLPFSGPGCPDGWPPGVPPQARLGGAYVRGCAGTRLPLTPGWGSGNPRLA